MTVPYWECRGMTVPYWECKGMTVPYRECKVMSIFTFITFNSPLIIATESNTVLHNRSGVCTTSTPPDGWLGSEQNNERGTIQQLSNHSIRMYFLDLL